MVIAVLVENVETILGLNGALMGTFIAFILPGLCYAKTLASDAKVLLIKNILKNIKLIKKVGSPPRQHDHHGRRRLNGPRHHPELAGWDRSESGIGCGVFVVY